MLEDRLEEDSTPSVGQAIACGVSKTFSLLKTVSCLLLAAEESSPPARVSSSDKTRVMNVER